MPAYTIYMWVQPDGSLAVSYQGDLDPRIVLRQLDKVKRRILEEAVPDIMTPHPYPSRFRQFQLPSTRPELVPDPKRVPFSRKDEPAVKARWRVA